MTAREHLDYLDALRAAGTPGRWTSDSSEIYQAMPGLPDHVNAGDWLGETCRVEGDPHYETSAADAALIVAAVNALPQLTAAIRAVLDLADNLEVLQQRQAVSAVKQQPGSPQESRYAGLRDSTQFAVQGIRTAITEALQ